MNKETTTIALVQAKASADKARNLSTAVDRVRDAAADGAVVICLQELFASEYFCQREDPSAFDLAESIPGDTTIVMTKVAAELGVTVIVPLFERRAPGVYHNTVLVVGPGGSILGKYRKMHIPDDPHYYEKFYFTPGDLGFVSVKTPTVNVGTLICWDQWYPEAARLTALRGADVLFYPTAIGWLDSDKGGAGKAQLDAWQTIQRSHAIANGVFVASCNRVGVEGGDDGIEFWGHSFVCDPFGRIIAEAGSNEEVLIVECDLRLVDEVRRDWPFLRDRRIDAYVGFDARLLDSDDDR